MTIDYSRAPHAWEKEKSNFVALLDLKLEFVEHGRAIMRMPYRSEITNGTGAVHGGAIVSLCDTV
ncbi:MAG: PaaI family thioesterase, partial [Candidatus Eremiobacteraeota bacterium]|nr:PaaI family thioesterase [Candidatus Eremiobacteraeota bacterium]